MPSRCTFRGVVTVNSNRSRTSRESGIRGNQSPADQRAIIAAADQLSSDDVVAAAAGIEQEARDVCKINLGL